MTDHCAFDVQSRNQNGLDEEEGIMRSIVANRNSVRCRALSMIMAFAAMASGGGVQAQTVDQVLDSIVVYGPTKPQGIVQSPDVAPLYYTSADTGAPSTPLSGATTFDACQNIGTFGLFCIGTTTSGPAVLRWDNPDRVATPTDVILCTQLGLASCTAMTVNLAGNMFVAGVKTGTTLYALVKVTRLAQQGGTCTGAWTQVSNKPYCYRQGFSGRPRIYELMMVDGPLDDWFLGKGAGVLALEDPAPGQITFYPDSEQPNVSPAVLVARTRWGNLLGNGETLQGLTLLQDAVASPSRNFFIVSTSLGKVLGYEIDWSLRGRAFNTGLALNALTLAPTPTGTCTVPNPLVTPVRFDLRASARTRRTFFIAGNCVAAYDPTIVANLNASVPVQFVGDDQTLDKVFGLATDFPLTGVTVSPGIEIDFVRDRCYEALPNGCDVIKNGAEVAAKLYEIKLASQSISGWLVYQITGLPDCRHISDKPAICNGAVVPAPPPVDPNQPYDPNDPTQQYLNITKLLPPEITDVIPPCTEPNGLQPPNCLPPMWLQPEYRARKTIPGTTGRAEYTLDALFGIPEPKLVYRDTFNAQFDIGDLFGNPAAKLGCGMHDPVRPPLTGGEPPPWDVVVNISELAPTVGGPALKPKEYVSVLLNSGCTNPANLTGGRGSAFLYGLERSPNVLGTPDRWFDSTFALLMRSLARDYDETLYKYACAAGDVDPTIPGSNVAPINATACYNLKKDWVVTYDKLLKCVGATDQPKNSAGSEACTSFEKQFEAYKVLALADAAVLKDPAASDRYNRVGEFLGRGMVLSYVYYLQFKLSIKDGGFVDPN